MLSKLTRLYPPPTLAAVINVSLSGVSDRFHHLQEEKHKVRGQVYQTGEAKWTSPLFYHISVWLRQLLYSEVILPSFAVADTSKANTTTNKSYKTFKMPGLCKAFFYCSWTLQYISYVRYNQITHIPSSANMHLLPTVTAVRSKNLICVTCNFRNYLTKYIRFL